MANLNIFGKDWTNIVFEGRNKKYGAYKLREENPKNTALALALGIVIMGVAFGGKSAYDSLFGSKSEIIKNIDDVEITEVILPDEVLPPEPEVIDEPEPEPEPIVEEEPADASKSVQDEVEFKETVVKKDDEVKNEQKTAQTDFDDTKTSGQKTQEGDKTDGDLKTEGQNTGQASKGSIGPGQGDTFSEDNKIYVAVSKKAEPSEGMSSWVNKFQRQFRTPDLGGGVNEISIRMQFVVERDGSITEIKVINDQYGVAKEAERVLRALPKWKPAEQNGKKVRSRFTLPLKVRVN